MHLSYYSFFNSFLNIIYLSYRFIYVVIYIKEYHCTTFVSGHNYNVISRL